MTHMPKRPSDDFLDICEDRYVLYATDIARAVISKRLLTRHNGDDTAACNALMDYMRYAVKSNNDSSSFCANFLTKFENTSFNSTVLLVDRMDFSLCRKVWAEKSDKGGLNLLGANEKDLLSRLNAERGDATHNKSGIHRMDLNYQKWAENREVLRTASIAYSSYIGPDTHAQIEDYYNGIASIYIAPAKSFSDQAKSLLSGNHWRDGLNLLFDHWGLAHDYHMACDMEKQFLAYYSHKDKHGNRINSEKVDCYIAQDMGGKERSQKAIEILARHYEKYALVRLEQFSGEKYVRYLEKIIDKYGNDKGRHYLTLSAHVTDPKLRRHYQRKGYSLGTSLTTIDTKGHFEDYCELAPTEWFKITEHDRDFFGAYMDKEQREILVRKEEEAYRWFMENLAETCESDRVKWLESSAEATKRLTEKSSVVSLRDAVLERVSKEAWVYRTENIAKFVRRNNDGTHSVYPTASIIRRDVPEYQQYLAAYEDFCKKDAQEWALSDALKLEEGTTYLSRVQEAIRNERSTLTAEYKKLRNSHSPKNQTLTSLLALQRRVIETKKRLTTSSLASNCDELNNPNELGCENFRLFFHAYPEPKPDALTNAFRSCNEELNGFKPLEKEINAKISQLRSQLHTDSWRRRISAVVAVILLLVAGYFAIQSSVLNKADRLMQKGDLVEAYSVLDKASAIYSKADTRRVECLALIRRTMVENGFRGEIVEMPDPVYPDNPVTTDPTVQSSDICVYRKPDGTYMTQFGAYWGEVRTPDGKELLAVQEGDTCFIVGICTDGTIVTGETYWDTHPKVVQSTSHAAAEAGIDLEVLGDQISNFKGVWIHGGVMILMADGTITDIFGRTQYADVVGFVSSRDDSSYLVPLASNGSYAQTHWNSYDSDVYDYFRGYHVTYDGHASGQKGNDHLFIVNSDAYEFSYLTVYDSEVNAWLSVK